MAKPKKKVTQNGNQNKPDENKPGGNKYIYKLTTHPELEEFKGMQTAFWPHPKPQPVSSDKIENFISNNIFLSAAYLVQLPALDAEMKKSANGKGTVIAILDTGVFDGHDDLKGKVLRKTNYKGIDGGDVDDKHGHGTHLAGIIAGTVRNRVIGGIAPGAKIVSVKVTDNRQDHTSWWKITDGMQRVIEHNEKAAEEKKVTAVIVCFNAFDNTDIDLCACHHRLCKLINILYAQNVPVIISAGNGFEYFYAEGLSYPAHMHNIICCGATYNYSYSGKNPGDLTEFTQRLNIDNKNFKNLFLLAPGKDTISCGIPNADSYKRLSGSCQASAVIAGVVLLLQQKYKDRMMVLPAVKKIQDCLARHCDVNENDSERPGSPSYKRKFRHLNAGRSLHNM